MTPENLRALLLDSLEQWKSAPSVRAYFDGKIAAYLGILKEDFPDLYSACLNRVQAEQAVCRAPAGSTESFNAQAMRDYANGAPCVAVWPSTPGVPAWGDGRTDLTRHARKVKP